MKTELPSSQRDRGSEMKRNQNFISRTVSKLALLCAHACLTVYKRLQPIPTQVQNGSTQSSAYAAMWSHLTWDHQKQCHCSTCKCEVLVTALRLIHIFAEAPVDHKRPNDWRCFHAICEPFTTTEMELLNTKDEEHIEDAYPTLAPVILTEIAARHRTGSPSPALQQRIRGLSCDVATFH
jgi:hypothetical protein